MSLQNKIALVTGASRGIGQAIAQQLAASGAQVIGTATTSSGAESITGYFNKLNLPVAGKELDNRDDQAIADLFSAIKQEFGVPTILVNNAGITQDNLMLRMTSEQWHNVVDVNLNSVFKITKAAIRGMMKQSFGRIITIGSVVGNMGNAGQVNYSATKAAIAGFSRSLAREIGSRNITVNVIAPGFIRTDMTDKLSDEQKQTLTQQIPLNRLGEVNDIAKAVKFLASDDASYITGETMHINGGMYMN